MFLGIVFFTLIPSIIFWQGWSKDDQAFCICLITFLGMIVGLMLFMFLGNKDNLLSKKWFGLVKNTKRRYIGGRKML